MKVLLVGHRGYIGTPLFKALELRGHQVVGVDANLYSPDFDPQKLVRAHDPLMTDLVMSSDAVIWLAAYAHDPLGRIPSHELYRNNFQVPLSYAQLINAAGGKVRFIVPSSLSIFADSPYSRSKWYLEQGLSNLHNFYKFVTIVRFGTVGGFYNTESFRAHLLLNSMVLGGLIDRRIVVRGPALRRPMLSLPQAVDTLADSLELGAIQQGQIGTFFDYCLSLEDCAQLVKRELKEHDIEAQVTHEAAVDSRDYGQDVVFGCSAAADVDNLVSALVETDLPAVDSSSKARLSQYYQNIQKI
jgi:nucleoside-diphosphate-sugar epimerase